MTALPVTATRSSVACQAGTSTTAAPCVCGGSDHFVQFYEDETFLVKSVGRFVHNALKTDATVLLIATAEHLEGFSRTLQAAGIEIEPLLASGRCVAIDAAELLPKLMVDGLPSEALFNRHVRSLVAKLTVGGRRLCAFGELVALAALAGKPAAAIKLERLWDALCVDHEFRLFCAYPIKAFATAAGTEPFLTICESHSRVLPTEDFLEPIQGTHDGLRAIAILQQKAAALEAEVADRKRIETRLRRREMELSRLVENASVGLHRVDQEGVILWANQAECRLLGYRNDELVGRNIAEFHVDAQVAAEILDCLRRGEEVRDREARLRGKDGSVKTVAIDSSGLWEDGRFVHSQCFTRDITGQREAEQAFRYLAAIVEGSDDAILSKNLNGIITSWNRAAERIFGYTADEMIGQPIFRLLPSDRIDEEVDILARLRRGERVDHFETIRRCKDGSLLNVSLTISPIRDDTGRIVGASKIARDITEKKRVDAALSAVREELARANEELERRVEDRTASLREAIAQLEEFSYTVSHDLRAPLRGMQVYSQALLEDHGPVLEAEARHCLTRISDNARRLDKMVLDVLTFSRVSRSDLNMETIDVTKLVHDIVHDYPALQPPRAVVDVANLRNVYGHEPSLLQVVSNLMSNAVKFVAPGVTPKIRIWTEPSTNGVKIFIQDNGIGIKPELQARLFRMFERLHPELPYEGTGVGLAIVRKAANRMGGDVGMESDGSNGTTFWVELPAARDENGA